METSTLHPFLRQGLDILFIGLNPATGSSRNRHYFSVNQAFWNQLFSAGLITAKIGKEKADLTVFGSTSINAHNWQYGITDLVVTIADSSSKSVRPTAVDCERLIKEIVQFDPRIAVLLHSKVRDCLARFLGRSSIPTEGYLGQWVRGADTEFFSVPFPHGNSIGSDRKVELYRGIAEYVLAH